MREETQEYQFLLEASAYGVQEKEELVTKVHSLSVSLFLLDKSSHLVNCKCRFP